jgi:hypothetical protein
MMVAAKSEELGFPPPYLENFSKAAAQNELVSGDLRPETDARAIGGKSREGIRKGVTDTEYNADIQLDTA